MQASVHCLSSFSEKLSFVQILFELGGDILEWFTCPKICSACIKNCRLLIKLDISSVIFFFALLCVSHITDKKQIQMMVDMTLLTSLNSRAIQ